MGDLGLFNWCVELDLPFRERALDVSHYVGNHGEPALSKTVGLSFDRIVFLVEYGLGEDFIEFYGVDVNG